MLKLNASFAKKVPAEVDYSSKSYMASVEVELPTNLSAEQLKTEIQNTYLKLEDAVESQIRGEAAPVPTAAPAPAAAPRRQQQSQSRSQQPAQPATNKQIQFILRLGQERQKALPELNAIAGDQFKAATIYDLTKRDASRMVDVLKQAA